MKRLLLLAVFALSISPVSAQAASLDDPGVPRTINLQSIVFDNTGQVTKSDKVDISVKILDADNNVVFEEEHPDVLVVRGAVNIDIGSESGGVPLNVLDPSTGTKFVDVMVDGHNPFDLMPLGAVPYAMWAEKAVTVANDSIGSEQIKDGSIKAEDIDPLAFSDIQGQLGDSQLPGSAVTVSQLQSHLDSTSAHPASAIVVSGSFINFVPTNVQEGLQKLDQKLADEVYNRQSGQKKLTDDLAAHAGTDINSAHPGEITSAKIADKTITNNDVSDAAAIATSKLSGAVTSITNHGLGGLATLNAVSGGNEGTITDDTITSADIKDGTVTTGDLSSDPGSGFSGWDTNASDDLTTGTGFGGDVGGKYNDIQLVKDAVGTSEIANGEIRLVDIFQDENDSASLENRYVNEGGDTMKGDLSFTDSNCTDKTGDGNGECTVDGVDVSALQGRVEALENNPLDQNIHDFSMTFDVQPGDVVSIGGSDASDWTACGDNSCNTDNQNWVYADRNPIIVPSGCVAMASGTLAANPSSYEASSSNFNADDQGYLKISYNDVRTVNLRANAIGDDGRFEVNIRVIAFPVNASADCSDSPGNWSY